MPVVQRKSLVNRVSLVGKRSCPYYFPLKRQVDHHCAQPIIPQCQSDFMFLSQKHSSRRSLVSWPELQPFLIADVYDGPEQVYRRGSVRIVARSQISFAPAGRHPTTHLSPAGLSLKFMNMVASDY
jgi:hypothetical protein